MCSRCDCVCHRQIPNANSPVFAISSALSDGQRGSREVGLRGLFINLEQWDGLLSAENEGNSQTIRHSDVRGKTRA